MIYRGDVTKLLIFLFFSSLYYKRHNRGWWRQWSSLQHQPHCLPFWEGWQQQQQKKKKVSVLLVIQLKEEATHPKMVNEVGTSCAWSAEKKHELTEPLVRRQRSNSYPPGLCRPFRTNEQVIAKDPAENGNFKSQPSLACCRKRPPFPFPSTPPFFAFFLLSPTAVLTFQNSL